MRKIRKHWVLAALVAVTALVLATAGGAGAQGVGEDGYIVGDIAASPSGGACIGGVVSLSGSGMPANGMVVVAMGKDEAGDGYGQLLGTTTADGAGSWSLTATVPATVIRDSDGASIATTAGSWETAAIGEDEVTINVGTLTVLNCTGKLPSTGPSINTGLIVIASLLAIAGAGFRIRRAWSA
ncbi:MAG: LPXTG cell wall anchor domain-containing protein [Thermoleophilia bacterium]